MLEDIIYAYLNFRKEVQLTADTPNYAVTFISRTMNKCEEHYALT